MQIPVIRGLIDRRILVNFRVDPEAGPEGAAARLGMKRSTLYKKMKKLGISRLD